MLSLLSVVSEVVQVLAFPGNFKFFVNDTPLPSDILLLILFAAIFLVPLSHCVVDSIFPVVLLPP
jgi:hypothetical protein